ncbi:MAG TPA: hypothetical protein VLV16_01325 [Gemmatimonadales bacterium]|nr:hypothetical protein [Gemmatimonadales bacterium]
MHLRVLAMLAAALAVAACSDAPSPTGLSSNGGNAIAPEAHFNQGGHQDHDRGKKHGHDDHQECDDDHGGKDHHRSHHGDKHGRYDHRWDRRGFDHHGKFTLHFKGHDDDDDDCTGGGGATTGSVSGSVLNNNAPANAFPVTLLSPDGATVVASTATDATGLFSFPTVTPGPYLVCEADPFTDQWGHLGETNPKAGPPCPAGYAPRAFQVTVAAGANSGGNDFTNFGLE